MRSGDVGHAGRACAARGFTYVALVVLLSVMSLAATCAFKASALWQRRAAETALLDAGAAFSDALDSYAEATPRGQARAPRTLQDLVRDPRFPMPRRHLRRILIDPLTGNDQWGLVELDTGPGIVGVYSLSPARPIKIGNFDLARSDFAGKRSYRDWIFGAEQSRARVRALQAAGKYSSPLNQVGDDGAVNGNLSPGTGNSNSANSDASSDPPATVSPLQR